MNKASPINWLEVAIVALVTMGIGAASVSWLPENFIDYGLLAACAFWTVFAVRAGWSRHPSSLYRVLAVVVGLAFIAWMAFVLSPLDIPM